jgi:hypothetical protein
MTTGDDQIRRWQESERGLRAVLAATDLPPAAALQIEEYLDHNELGLAFQAFVFEIDAGQTLVSAEVVERLRAVLERMDVSVFDADELAAWERLQLRSQP